jgi:hypothetical protein
MKKYGVIDKILVLLGEEEKVGLRMIGEEECTRE